MKFFTSLSPNPRSISTQQTCTTSWVTHGHKVVCVQGPDDDVRESAPDNAEIMRFKPIMAGRQSRPYIALDSILEAFLATGDKSCCIINGDIEISDPLKLMDAAEATGRLVCGRRWDHDGVYDHAKVFPNGFDFFIIHREHALATPRSMFVIGQTFWDYWLPWSCSMRGYRLVTIGPPVAYHRRHPMNYGHEDWVRTVQHFLWLTRRPLNSAPNRVSAEVHRYLTSKITQL